MEYQKFPLFPKAFNLSSDLESNLPKDNGYPSSLSNSLENIKSEDLLLLFSQKKSLFKTEKIKTSYLIFKCTIPSEKEKKEKTFSNGRWTKQERIKFAEALYHFGINWKKISKYITTRNAAQLRSHTQKFLNKLKKDKFIVQKGLDFTQMNWQQSLTYLKEHLTEQEFLDVLYSIETELDDNKRMTEKYLERKRKGPNQKNYNLNPNNESLNSSTYTTLNGFNYNSCKNTNNEQEKENLKENNSSCALLPLEEIEDNNFSDDLSKEYYTNNKNIIYNNILERPNIDENVDDEYSFGQASPLEYKNLINLIDFRLI